jgi:hypothetical protein
MARETPQLWSAPGSGRPGASPAPPGRASNTSLRRRKGLAASIDEFQKQNLVRCIGGALIIGGTPVGRAHDDGSASNSGDDDDEDEDDDDDDDESTARAPPQPVAPTGRLAALRAKFQRPT